MHLHLCKQPYLPHQHTPTQTITTTLNIRDNSITPAIELKMQTSPNHHLMKLRLRQTFLLVKYDILMTSLPDNQTKNFNKTTEKKTIMRWEWVLKNGGCLKRWNGS